VEASYVHTHFPLQEILREEGLIHDASPQANVPSTESQKMQLPIQFGVPLSSTTQHARRCQQQQQEQRQEEQQQQGPAIRFGVPPQLPAFTFGMPTSGVDLHTQNTSPRPPPAALSELQAVQEQGALPQQSPPPPPPQQQQQQHPYRLRQEKCEAEAHTAAEDEGKDGMGQSEEEGDEDARQGQGGLDKPFNRLPSVRSRSLASYGRCVCSPHAHDGHACTLALPGCLQLTCGPGVGLP